jgi:hypothetical protein
MDIKLLKKRKTAAFSGVSCNSKAHEFLITLFQCSCGMDAGEFTMQLHLTVM